jgi:integrase
MTEFPLSDLLALLPHPIPWEQFKAEILPSWTPPLVSPQRSQDVKRVIREIETINLAADGAEPRCIDSTADLSATLLARYVASRPAGESPYTLRCRLTTLQTICNRALARRYLAISPFAETRIRQIVRVGKPRRKRALSLEETRRLLLILHQDVERRVGWQKWKSRRLLVAVVVALHAGLRRTELLTLRVADLDLSARVIRLVPRGLRGQGLKTEASAKPVGMPLALIPLIQEWLDHRLDAPAGWPIDPACPWLIPTCSRRGPWLHGKAKGRPLGRLKAVGRRAGAPDVTWQMLRRTCATMMEAAGAGRSQIQRQLRHTTPETTEVYYIQADETNIAAAVRDLTFE